MSHLPHRINPATPRLTVIWSISICRCNNLGDALGVIVDEISEALEALGR